MTLSAKENQELVLTLVQRHFVDLMQIVLHNLIERCAFVSQVFEATLKI